MVYFYSLTADYMYKDRQEFLKKRYDPVANRTINYQNDPRLKVVLSFLAKQNSTFQVEAKIL